MPSASETELRDAIARDLGILRWDGEEDGHWTGRCVYSAAGRIALHLLWDDERPVHGTVGEEAAPPIDGTEAPAIGSISFFHFWKGLDRALGAFAQLFPEAFGGSAKQGDGADAGADAILRAEAQDMSRHRAELAETDWGGNPTMSTAFPPDESRRWLQWLFTRYLETGFLRHKPMRVGPVRDRVAMLGDVAFLRGSHLDAGSVHMSGLAMFRESGGDAELAEPFEALRLLPAKRTLPSGGGGSPRALQIKQTVQNLLGGTLEPIEFSVLPAKDGNKVVRFSVPFSLPDDERNLFLLCSWPGSNKDFGKMDNRTMAAPLFDGIKAELGKLGYLFREMEGNRTTQ